MRKFLIKVNSLQYEVELEEVKGSKITKQIDGAKIKQPLNNCKTDVSFVQDSSSIIAPMSGSILKVNVKNGESVKRGQVLLALEAMKMENEITADADGKISSIKVEVGQVISQGEVLVVIE